jgi:hypothetical protein
MASKDNNTSKPKNDTSNGRRGGIGSISGTGHTIIKNPKGPVHTGTGSTYINGKKV